MSGDSPPAQQPQRRGKPRAGGAGRAGQPRACRNRGSVRSTRSFGPRRVIRTNLRPCCTASCSGPIAPTVKQRGCVTAPALVMGHPRGVIHRFKDAETLARRLADARLVPAHNVAELWLRPGRLTAELGAFLDDAWTGCTDVQPQAPRVLYSVGTSDTDPACGRSGSGLAAGPAAGPAAMMSYVAPILAAR